ncbi:MAG: amidohydrolase family protein [Deltaproteobacteria bacterium]|nr:amidohydrolase family protein [Deltaproteobacteria bacterium]
MQFGPRYWVTFSLFLSFGCGGPTTPQHVLPGVDAGALPDAPVGGDGRDGPGGRDAAGDPPDGSPPKPTSSETCKPEEILPCESRAGEPSADGVILRGTVASPDRLLCHGDVLYSRAQGKILCVGPDCSSDPGAKGAAITCIDVISPGLIDAHNHMQYNHLPRFRHDVLYKSRSQWQQADEYDKFRSANKAMGEAKLTCEVVKWSEVRQLLAGTTSVVGSAGGECIAGLERNLDEGPSQNGLDFSGAEYVTFISRARPDDLRTALANRKPVVVHIAEGVDLPSRTTEWETLEKEKLVAALTSIVHGTALSATQFGKLGVELGHLVWSPRSNIDLYGLTTPITTAKLLGVPVAIGTDWTPSGSLNILEELQCADSLNQKHYDRVFSDRELVAGVTLVPARALGLDDKIGRIATGLVADLAGFRGSRQAPFRAIIDALNDDVSLVVVGGKAIYGDREILQGLSLEPGELCEDLAPCGRARRACVKMVREADSLKRNQSLADIEGILKTALANAQKASGCQGDNCYPYELMPLFQCDPPPRNPCSLGEITPDDSDGDGMKDATDKCRSVFDRPLFGLSEQEDLDGDGLGDACDPCPLTAEATCPTPDRDDLDGDGTSNDADNCPLKGNLDQADGDFDGIGDACDACLTDTDVKCSTLRALRDPRDPAHPEIGTEVKISGAVVTAIKNAPENDRGLWIQDPSAKELGGLYLYFRANDPPPVQAGQKVNVTGKYSEFFGTSQIVSPSVTVSTDEPLSIEPILVTDSALIATGGAMAEPLEGMLVKLAPEGGISVTSSNPDAPKNYDEFQVDGKLRVDDLIIDGTDNLKPAYSVGQRFKSITGILHFSFGNYKLEPRSPEDLASE